MTEEDFTRIENELETRLPESYRRAMSALQLPPGVGKRTEAIWDDAGEVIDLNRELRDTVPGWPRWLFAVGRMEGDSSGYAIDLRWPECPVWWLDHMRPAPASGSGPNPEPFAGWLARVVAEIDLPTEGESRSLLIAVAIWLGLAIGSVAAYLAWLRFRPIGS